MDCAKFETTMIDELYGELDELTSAAVNRHATGCARCAALIGGLRATRRVATLPLAEAPADLEERILAATKSISPTASPASGEPSSSRVVAMPERRRALAWVTRPQLAMAAVFLLMVGASAVFLRKGADEPERGAQSVAAAAPSAAAPTEVANLDGKQREDESPALEAKSKSSDDTVAASAATPAPSASAAAVVALAPAREAAHAAPEKPNLLPPSAANFRRGELDEDKRYIAKKETAADDNLKDRGGAGRVAQAPAAAPPPPSLPQSRANFGGDGPMNGVNGYSNQGYAATIAGARAAFDSGRYAEAFRIADSLAANDPNAALLAARSLERMGGGCAAAVQRYDELARRAQGTSAGYEATLEAGRCFRALGNAVAARDRLNRLLPNAAYAPRARQILDTVPAATAQPPPQATTTAAPADQQQQQQQRR